MDRTPYVSLQLLDTLAQVLQLSDDDLVGCIHQPLTELEEFILDEDRHLTKYDNTAGSRVVEAYVKRLYIRSKARRSKPEGIRRVGKDRRLFDRYESQETVKIFQQPAGRASDCKLLDISPSGLSFASCESLSVGTEVTVELDESIRVAAIVRHCTQTSEFMSIGVSFIFDE